MFVFIVPTMAIIFVHDLNSLIVYSSIIIFGMLSTSVLLQCGKYCKTRTKKKVNCEVKPKSMKGVSPVPSIPNLPTPALELESVQRQPLVEEAKAEAIDAVAIEKGKLAPREEQLNPQSELEKMKQNYNDEEEYNSCPDLTPNELNKLAYLTPL